jgi:hypothetical protein
MPVVPKRASSTLGDIRKAARGRLFAGPQLTSIKAAAT